MVMVENLHPRKLTKCKVTISKFDDMWAGVLRIIEDYKFFTMVMEAEAAGLSL